MHPVLPTFLPTRFLLNPRPRGDGHPGPGTPAVLDLQAHDQAYREISSWEGYAPTPLRTLPGLAGALGVATLWYKDEAERLGLGSFKALGGTYGVFRALLSHLQKKAGIPDASSEGLRAGGYRDLLAPLTVTCASAGNHGRAVALGASMFGCRCVIFLPSDTSHHRREAIRELGADIVEVEGSYDDAVARADQVAEERDWIVVSDTAYPGQEELPASIMAGYTVMAREVLDQLSPGPPPTHVFLQAGVGGLAASVTGYFRERLASRQPRMVVVEPDEADGLFQSALSAGCVPSGGSLDTTMSCLACRIPSTLAWGILEGEVQAFLTIPDQAAEEVLRLLARGVGDDEPILSQPSGVAGLTGLMAALMEPALSDPLALGPESRVLVFGTEGPPTEPPSSKGS